MSKGKIGRPLRILVIDDNDQRAFVDGHSTHAKVETIAWKDAQEKLARDVVVDGADILLIDVSMQDDPLIAGALTKGSSVPILPAGPLIALPFIGARAIMSLKIYSAHKHNPDLKSHPYFLLAMGLIAARTEGIPKQGVLLSRHLCPGAASCLLDKVIQELTSDSIADPAAAFAPALEDYRSRLEQMVTQQLVTVYNRTEAILEFQRLRKGCPRGKSIAIPATLNLEIAGKGWSDCISIMSLFADKLGSSSNADSKWLTEVEDWVRGLGESAEGRAIEVTRKQNESEAACPDDKIIRPKATDVIRSLYGSKLHRTDLTEILRFVVLFANAFALDHPEEGSGKITKVAVFQRLGTGIEDNIYFGLFGKRKTKRTTGKARKSKMPFDKIRPLSTQGNERERCFLSPDSSPAESDRDAIQRYRSADL